MDFDRESIINALMRLELFESREPRLEQPCSTPSSEAEEDGWEDEDEEDDISSEVCDSDVSKAEPLFCISQNGNNRWTKDRIQKCVRAYRRRKWLHEHYLNTLYFYAVYDIPEITSCDSEVYDDVNLGKIVNVGTLPRHFTDDVRTLCLAIGKKIVATYTPDEDEMKERLGREMRLLDRSKMFDF